MIKNRKKTLFLLFASFFLSSQLPAVEPQFLIVGTAGPTGVYYPAGNAICRVINKERKKYKTHSIHCNAIRSEGSLANLDGLGSGEIDFAITQGDVLNDVYKGANGQGENLDLRTLLRLYNETLAIVVSKKSGIENIKQLLGKRVSFGEVGSGQRHTMNKLLSINGWGESDFILVDQYTQSQLASALCTSQIDGFAFMAGQPSALLKQVSNECDTRILNIDEVTLEQLTHLDAVYKKAVIPAKMYQGNTQIQTVSVPALLVATQFLGDDEASNIIDNIMKNIEEIKTMHPALETFDVNVSNVLAPIHKASSEFFLNSFSARQ